MCLFCGKEAKYKVECRWFDGTIMQPVKAYLCADHAKVYEFLFQYDQENPEPTSFANLFLGFCHVGLLEELKGDE